LGTTPYGLFATDNRYKKSHFSGKVRVDKNQIRPYLFANMDHFPQTPEKNYHKHLNKSGIIWQRRKIKPVLKNFIHHEKNPFLILDS